MAPASSWGILSVRRKSLGNQADRGARLDWSAFGKEAVYDFVYRAVATNGDDRPVAQTDRFRRQVDGVSRKSGFKGRNASAGFFEAFSYPTPGASSLAAGGLGIDDRCDGPGIVRHRFEPLRSDAP